MYQYKIDTFSVNFSRTQNMTEETIKTIHMLLEKNNKIIDNLINLLQENPSTLEQVSEQNVDEQQIYKTKRTKKKLRYIPKVIGIKNVENTCYMNSIIQCIAHSPTLLQYFLELCPLNGVASNETRLINQFYLLLKNMVSSEHTSPINSNAFKRSLELVHSGFNGNHHQDAGEFLMIILDCVHTQLTKYNQSQLSSFEDICYVTQKNEVICDGCERISKSNETFLYISFDLPKNNQPTSITNCLDKWVSPETIEGYSCNTCTQRQSATRTYSFHTLPSTLMIQIKRFQQNERNQAEKLLNDVTYSEDLILTKWDGSKSIYVKYELTGVVCHSGTLDGGHYVSHCKLAHTSTWYMFNDDHCVQETPIVYDTKGVYILFYERQ